MAGDDLSRLSKRDRKRLKREVGRELKRQLRETKAEGKRLAAERAQLERDRRHHASDVYRQVKATSKRTQESTQAARAKRDRAAEVVDAIGYDLMFKNGICEVEQGLFSETIEFDDITYQNARDSDQLDMLKVIFDLHNGVSDRMCLQYGVINSRLRKEQVGTRTFFDPAAQATGQGAADAVEMNKILNAKLLEGVSNITRRRLLTVSTLAVDADEAVRSLAGFNTMLATNFERLRCGWRVLDGTERLSIVNSMLRPGTELDFDFDRDLSVASPLTTKDFVAPASLDFAPGGSDFWFRSNGKCCQVLVMRALDSPLDDRCIANIAVKFVNFASVFVLSSDFEGMPNALLEALAMGVPCVSTRCEMGPDELIENRVSGILTDVGSSEQLAEAILEIIENPDFAKKLSENGRKLLETHSIENISRQWLDYLNRI